MSDELDYDMKFMLVELDLELTVVSLYWIEHTHFGLNTRIFVEVKWMFFWRLNATQPIKEKQQMSMISSFFGNCHNSINSFGGCRLFSRSRKYWVRLVSCPCPGTIIISFIAAVSAQEVYDTSSTCNSVLVTSSSYITTTT